ncbi:hypothetical protein BWZ20_00260 [Winogradskyella sp. J14-2]|nr:hypothetical protein BWZ20_00260 [Winogradskyella sp. J14-2]
MSKGLNFSLIFVGLSAYAQRVCVSVSNGKMSKYFSTDATKLVKTAEFPIGNSVVIAFTRC